MSRWYILLTPILLGLTGAALNSVRVPFFYESYLIIGPFVALFTVIHRGYLSALIVSFVSSIPLALHWNDVWPLIIYASEVLILGLYYRKISKNLILGVIVFWLIMGMPLLYFYFTWKQSVLSSHLLVFILQHMINAIIALQLQLENVSF